MPIWRQAEDGVRLRLAYWTKRDAIGTIFLFPGRTEPIEKYGRVVQDLTDRGYAVITIDWRGQGFSDRLTDDNSLGHVNSFRDYQLDVAEMVSAAQGADLPEPWFLLSHSMGGIIALRALVEKLPVKSAVFSAPMWGLRLPLVLRLMPFVVPPLYRLLGRHFSYAPGARPANYVASTEFEENLLTTDAPTYGRLVQNASTEPAFALGGPSIHWVGQAAVEGFRLARLARPDLPVLTFLGSREGVVSLGAIRRIHAKWPSANLHIVPDAKHELMMETPERRRQFFDVMFEFLASDKT